MLKVRTGVALTAVLVTVRFDPLNVKFDCPIALVVDELLAVNM